MIDLNWQHFLCEHFLLHALLVVLFNIFKMDRCKLVCKSDTFIIDAGSPLKAVHASLNFVILEIFITLKA